MKNDDQSALSLIEGAEQIQRQVETGVIAPTQAIQNLDSFQVNHLISQIEWKESQGQEMSDRLIELGCALLDRAQEMRAISRDFDQLSAVVAGSEREAIASINRATATLNQSGSTDQQIAQGLGGAGSSTFRANATRISEKLGEFLGTLG